MNNEIHSTISQFLKKAGWPVLLDPSLHLKDDLCLDSLDIVELMMHLEKQFNINYDDHVSEQITTIEDLINLTSYCWRKPHE